MARFPLRTAVCACLLTATILPTAALSGTIQADGGLRLRSEASTSGSILTTMSKGSKVEILSEVGSDWYEVSYGGRTGFAFGEYIDIIQETAPQSETPAPQVETPDQQDDTIYIQVIEGPLNIRSGAGTDSKKVGSLSVGSRAEVISVQDGWYQIEAGFVHGDYVKEIDASQMAASSDLGQQIADFALQFVGCPYVYGGNGPNSFDCSGLIKYVMANFGININRTASAQLNNGTPVSISELQPGDAVYFRKAGSSTAASHTGIYIGGGQFVHASDYGVGVIVSDLDYAYYTTGFVGGRRMG